MIEGGTLQPVHREPQIKLLENAWILPAARTHKTGSRDWDGGGLYLNSGTPDPWLIAHMGQDTSLSDSDRDAAKFLPGEYLFGGMMKRHFGHFLVESISRLWALDDLGKKIPIAFVSNSRRGMNAGATAEQFFQLIGLKNPIYLAKNPVQIGRVWNAECLYDPMIGEPMQEKLREWIFARISERQAPNLVRLARKIVGRPNFDFDKGNAGKFGSLLYVTRSGLDAGFGRLLGESAVESGLMSEGYRTFQPESHTLADQIIAYKNADRIVLSESSSFHLMSIFCNSTARVAMILRRPDPPAGIRAALESFQSPDVHFVSAFKAIWQEETLGKTSKDVAEMNFPGLWSALKSLDFIASARDKPIPSETDLTEERLRIAPDRLSRLAMDTD